MNKAKIKLAEFAEKRHFNVNLKFWSETVKESLSGRTQAAEAFKLRGSPLTSGCDTYTEKKKAKLLYVPNT